MKFQELMKLAGVEYRESGHEHCRQGWIQIDCPFCARVKHFRLGYNVQRKYLNCWACGPHRLLETLMMVTSWPMKDCYRLIDDLDYGKIDKIPFTGKLVLPNNLGPLKKPHIKYLRKNRRFTPTQLDQIIKLWKIQGIGELGGRLVWRIFIPVYHQGEVVSWTTRSISDVHERRYIAAGINEERIPKNHLLYGEDYVHNHTIIICEGPLDVWKIGPGAVCTFGTGFTSHQINRMRRYLTRVVLYDNEPEGQKKASALCDRLQMFDGNTFNVTLNAKDPGSAQESEIRELRKRFLCGESSITAS